VFGLPRAAVAARRRDKIDSSDTLTSLCFKLSPSVGGAGDTSKDLLVWTTAGLPPPGT